MKKGVKRNEWGEKAGRGTCGRKRQEEKGVGRGKGRKIIGWEEEKAGRGEGG